ncbi:MAG: hypothetical protein H6730_12510 [Deltaproteobacteria bacterium]|nr:hypothetical protein [Deltaproteobacteria bacterium]
MGVRLEGLGRRGWLPAPPAAPRSPPAAGANLALPFDMGLGRVVAAHVGPPDPRRAGLPPAWAVAPGQGARVPAFRQPQWALDDAAEALVAAVQAAEQDLAASEVHGAALLAAARARFEAHGVQVEDHVTAEGFAALRILPDHATAPGALAAFLDRELDGFRLLYAPKKLLDQETRGSVWGHQREVFAAHGLVVEGRPDPITLHEVEHAVLNLLEERGVPHRWLGFLQSIDGDPISAAHEAQGGYVTYASIQEVPAYAAQVRALGRRLAAELVPGPELTELGAMARWGRALAGRTRDVAERALAHAAEHPENAVFELRRNTPAGRAPEGTPEVLWASVDRPDVRISFPLFAAEAHEAHADMQAANDGDPDEWAEARGRLLTVLRRRLLDLAAAAGAAERAFDGLVRGVEAEPKSRAALRALANKACQLSLR